MSWIVLAAIIMLNCSKESNPVSVLRKNTIISKSGNAIHARISKNGKTKSIPKTFLSKVERDEGYKEGQRNILGVANMLHLVFAR